MLSPADLEDRFAHALLDAALPVPAGLLVPADAAAEERFAVYRNNVAVGLIEALRSAFPVVDQLVGGDFFAAMARVHALETPPASPVLLAYGGDFPAFIAGFPPAASLPYLADVAAVEWLWLEAYHAADRDPLTVDALAAVSPDRLPMIRLTPHPAARLGRFDHPVVSIWRFHQGEARGELALGEAPEQALFVRPQAAVSIVDLSPGGFAFVAALRDGASLAEAADAALAVEADIDIAGLLPHLFAVGAFADFTEGDEA